MRIKKLQKPPKQYEEDQGDKKKTNSSKLLAKPKIFAKISNQIIERLHKGRKNTQQLGNGSRRKDKRKRTRRVKLNKNENQQNVQSELLKLSQEIILNFLRKNITDESLINQIKNFLENFPISQDAVTDAFLDSQNAQAEVAMSLQTGKMTMLIRTNINITIENIMVVIHEYAHALSNCFSSSKQELGILKTNIIIEEAMAVNFAEACVNEWIKDGKSFEENKAGVMQKETIYPEERSILNTILLALNKDGLDNQAMIEYLIGDKAKFLELCTERLGTSFVESFSIIEKEISARNPTGEGFSDRRAIREIYALVSRKLMNIIPEETLNELSEENNDLTKATNRYLRTSSIIKRKVLIRDIINSGEFDIEDCNELVELGLDSIDDERVKQEIKRIKEWREETGCTVRQLVKHGAKLSDIQELLWQYDPKTGEKLDRISRTRNFIQNLQASKGGTEQLKKVSEVDIGDDNSVRTKDKRIIHTADEIGAGAIKDLNLEQLSETLSDLTGSRDGDMRDASGELKKDPNDQK